jgi:hypothetical protein
MMIALLHLSVPAARIPSLLAETTADAGPARRLRRRSEL